MKDKILLVGKLSEILGNINDALGDDYDTQISSMDLENISGIIKVIHPKMIIICTVGLREINTNIFAWINKSTGDMPVLIISSKSDNDQILKLCGDERFIFCNPPIDNDTILSLCKNALYPEEEEEEEKEAPIIYKDSGKTLNDRSVKDKLTAAKSGDKEQAKDKTEGESGDKKKILAIDDSPVVLRNLKLLLKDDYDVILATSGEMGIKRAHEEKPDAILLDYEMPQMNGSETFMELCSDDDTLLIPVIFLTGVHDQERVREVLSMGPAGYVLKPIDADTIKQMLTKVLNKG